MKKKYGWNEKFISSYYYEIETGKIVGQYSKITLSDEIYHAEVNGDNLGQYISEKCARAAIEKFTEKNDQDNENAKKFIKF